jgi:AmmeMemoRadiSam system protein B
MTVNRTGDTEKTQRKAKRSICSYIAMAAALLCLFGAITGCASSAARLTEAGQGTVNQETAQQLIMPETGLQDSSPTQNPGSAPEDADVMSSRPTLRCNYYVEKEFMASVEAAEHQGDTGTRSGASTNGTNSGRIAGGITPHHLLAAKMIAGFFRELSYDQPKTIVVIGPNHKRIGFGGLQTSSSDWATPFGRLEADGEIVKILVDKLNASENDSVMQEDHAISALVPYIRYYMPDVRIVPILLHGNYSSADSLRLGKLLGKISSDDSGSIAIIASVDFSHYLDAGTAYKMDDITLKAIRNNDIKAISRMSNDNMDSPPSIITMLGAMGAIGAAGPETAGHSNSSDITGSGYDNTTSYFTMFFRYIDK